jgi:hypothetical protein
MKSASHYASPAAAAKCRRRKAAYTAGEAYNKIIPHLTNLGRPSERRGVAARVTHACTARLTVFGRSVDRLLKINFESQDGLRLNQQCL